MESENPPGVITQRCVGGVDQLLRRAVARAEGLGLEVFGVIDHSGEAADAGLTMPDTKVVIFGSPEGDTRIMLAHPLIALDLPLKLLLWESDNGEVFASYRTSRHLANRYELTEDETDALRVVETVVQTVVAN